jgi:hypothetical protein
MYIALIFIEIELVRKIYLTMYINVHWLKDIKNLFYFIKDVILKNLPSSQNFPM